MKLAKAMFMLVLGTDLVRFSHAQDINSSAPPSNVTDPGDGQDSSFQLLDEDMSNSPSQTPSSIPSLMPSQKPTLSPTFNDINITSTAPPSTITNPEDGQDSSFQLLDEDLANYLQNIGDLTVEPSEPFEEGINVLDCNITWTSNSSLVLRSKSGDVNLIGPGIISAMPEDPSASSVIRFESKVFSGARDSAEKRSGQGNTATSRSMVVVAPTIDVETDGDFNHNGVIDAVGASGTVTVLGSGDVNIGEEGSITGENIAIDAVVLTIADGGTISGQNVMITAQTVNGNVTGTGACGEVNVGGSITYLDMVDPEITCPDDITVSLEGAMSETAVTFDDATATDNCDDDPNVSTDIASGSNFPLGTTTVTATAMDMAGNSATCSFTVTVLAEDMCKTVDCSPGQILMHHDFVLFCTDTCVGEANVEHWKTFGYSCGPCGIKG